MNSISCLATILYAICIVVSGWKKSLKPLTQVRELGQKVEVRWGAAI